MAGRTSGRKNARRARKRTPTGWDKWDSKVEVDFKVTDYVTPRPIEEEFDYDRMYRKELKDPDVAKNKSLLKAMFLKMVKSPIQGVDTSLPAFIMDRRSVLEMYSDFIRPGLLVDINEGKTPRDRMIRAVRFYLGGLSGMRGMTNAARKPFNPALGELFRCALVPKICNSMDSHRSQRPQDSRETAASRKWNYADNGLIFCEENEVSFLAEQVSHHPPISAFYAECKGSQMSLSGTVAMTWRFVLGASVGFLKSVASSHAGEVLVTSHGHKERYHMGLPDMETEHPLTNPKVRIVNSVKIYSPQTKYHANVKFSNKKVKNWVSVHVFGPESDKNPITVIEGVWSEKLEIVKNDGIEDRQLFLDMKKYHMESKYVMGINNMVWFESRRIWRKVVRGLSEDNDKAAGEEKAAVEARQRKMKLTPFFFEAKTNDPTTYVFMHKKLIDNDDETTSSTVDAI